MTQYEWRVSLDDGQTWYYDEWQEVGGWGRCLWGCDFVYKYLELGGAEVGATYSYEVRAVSGEIVGPPALTSITFTGDAAPREPVAHTLFDWSKDFSAPSDHSTSP